MSNSYKLLKKILIKGEIIAETGLMVGGSSTAFEIGGTDKQVVRNPINKLPYIPGSSLKGKMRSLLELSKGTISSDGKTFGPTHDPAHIAAQLFGHIKSKSGNNNKSQQASRIIVRDAELTNPDAFENTESLYAEIKAENTIDRITSAANPRFFERVPKGARFALNIIINVFEHDHLKSDFLKQTFAALRLVQDDYLGGGGSRGNGQVRFEISSVVERDDKYYTQEAKEVDISEQIPDVLKLRS